MKNFDHPIVVGLVGKSIRAAKAKTVQKKFERIFKSKKYPIAYLLLKVEPKYLKNVLKCMKIMDISGLNVTDEYSKGIMRYLDKIDASAKAKGKVNTVAKTGKKLTGYFLEDIFEGSVKLWCKRVK